MSDIFENAKYGERFKTRIKSSYGQMEAYITEDKDGQLILWYGLVPVKEGDFWDSWDNKYISITRDLLPEGCNPKYTDDEAVKVEIEIKIKS